MLLHDIAAAWRDVAATSGRGAKVGRLSSVLSAAHPEEVEIAVALLIGRPRQGRLGVGPAAIGRAWPNQSAATPTLTLVETDTAIERIKGIGGAGSTDARLRALRGLLERGTAVEQQFLRALLYGELRQGALEGVMLDAVARASDIDPTVVRRAHMFVGDLPRVAREAKTGGEPALRGSTVSLFRPLQPMLAQSADAIDEAWPEHGAVIDYKFDGARIQVHKRNDDVRAYSRKLRDVSASIPEVIEFVRALPADELVLDGETLAVNQDARPLPFQVTMRRFGSRLDVGRLRQELPLHTVAFDVLYRDGAPLVDLPLTERLRQLDRLVPERHRAPRLETNDADQAGAFLRQALETGHEGVMIKTLDATYDAGRRGGAWTKIKPAHTLDLVVLAADWGHGRRRGWLSNLHLGARDEATGQFVMLGKTFKGMTDQMLTWQTERLQQLAVAHDSYTVQVRPELVVEIAFNDVQTSSNYPGGVALRFARVKRYRGDKLAEDADTLEAVRRLLPAGQ
jgi:DNA ligase-1